MEKESVASGSNSFREEGLEAQLSNADDEPYEDLFDEPLEQQGEADFGEEEAGDEESVTAARRYDHEQERALPATAATASQAHAQQHGTTATTSPPAHATAGGGATDARDRARPATEDLNKKYLQLLATGRLASRKKAELQESTSLRGSRKDLVLAAELQRARSVHETDLTRLTMTSAVLDQVAPVSRTSRPPSTQDHMLRSSLASTSSSTSPSKSRACSTGELPRVALLSPTTSSSLAGRKILTPGPGAYETASSAASDRSHGGHGPACSFGTSRQRPPNACVVESSVSPGPVYNPHQEFTSTHSSTTRSSYTFPRQDVGSRFSQASQAPSNAPQWNPGPGDYDAQRLPNGQKTEIGGDAPKTVFGKSLKAAQLSPQRSLSASAFISEGHAKRENATLNAANTPGPGLYNPDDAATRARSCRFSLAPKAASYFDQYLDPTRQPSPGPIYPVANVDNRGGKAWGYSKATFGRSKKLYEPEVNLSASVFISKEHAAKSNLALHSPGPIYLPDVPTSHVRSPTLASGPADRFYDRFEKGRL